MASFLGKSSTSRQFATNQRNFSKQCLQYLFDAESCNVQLCALLFYFILFFFFFFCPNVNTFKSMIKKRTHALAGVNLGVERKVSPREGDSVCVPLSTKLLMYVEILEASPNEVTINSRRSAVGRVDRVLELLSPMKTLDFYRRSLYNRATHNSEVDYFLISQ